MLVHKTLTRVALVLLGLVAGASFAAGQQRLSDLLKREMDVTDASLAECRLAGGGDIGAQRCAEWKRTLDRAYADEAKTSRDATATTAANAAYESEKASQLMARERRQAELRAEREKAAAETKAREEQYLKQRAAEDAAAAATAQRGARAEDARKVQCGADYKSPRIGMPIERAQQCVTGMRITAQVNRADGVLTTYQGGNAYFHVMDGRIVAWGRL